VIISESELLSKLIAETGWTHNKAKKAIDLIFSVEIKMIDDGVETDSLYIHY
jgi:hypothetical protein